MSVEKWKVMKAHERYGEIIQYQIKRQFHGNGSWIDCAGNSPSWDWRTTNYRVKPPQIRKVTALYFVNSSGGIATVEEDSVEAGRLNKSTVWMEVSLCK